MDPDPGLDEAFGTGAYYLLPAGFQIEENIFSNLLFTSPDVEKKSVA
jgi:hypothetical protein